MYTPSESRHDYYWRPVLQTTDVRHGHGGLINLDGIQPRLAGHYWNDLRKLPSPAVQRVLIYFQLFLSQNTLDR